MSEFAEDKAKKVNKRNWVSLVPYGVNQQHPNNYRDILDSVWENRDNLDYAFRILRDGCCDGCSLGTSWDARLDYERHPSLRRSVAVAAVEHYARHGCTPFRRCRTTA